MNQSDYERRRKHLENEQEAALELIQAAFRTQFRALDLVWMSSPENAGTTTIVYDPPRAPRPLALLSSSASAGGPAAAGAPPLAPRRRGIGDLYYEVRDVLDELPEVFDRTHLMALLDPRPKRSSLYKVLEEMRYGGLIDLVQAGGGSHPSTYRRKPLASDEAADDADTEADADASEAVEA